MTQRSLRRPCRRAGRQQRPRARPAPIHQMAGVRGYVVKLQQLEQLRERQARSELRTEVELTEARDELRRLERANASNVEAAEAELVKLTTSLQESLRRQSALQTRCIDVDSQVAALAERRARLSMERDDVAHELRTASEEFRELDAAVASERQAKTTFLHELHERRQVAEQLQFEAAEAAATQAAMEAEVRTLRRAAEQAANLELSEERTRAACEQRLRRDAFAWFVVSVRAVRRFRLCARARKVSERSSYCAWALVLWRRHSMFLARRRRCRRQAALDIARRLFRAWAVITADDRWLNMRRPAADAMRRRMLLRQMVRCWFIARQVILDIQTAPARRRLGRAVLRSWRAEAAVVHWLARLQAWFARRVWRRAAVHLLEAWRGVLRAKAWRHRTKLVLARRVACRKVSGSMQWWHLCHTTRSRGRAVLRAYNRPLLASCWWALWKYACLQRQERLLRGRLLSHRAQSSLRRGIQALLDNSQLAWRVQRLARRVHDRVGALSVSLALRCWLLAVGQRLALRVTTHELLRRRLNVRLVHWRAATRRRISFQRTSFCFGALEAVSASKSRQSALRFWASAARGSRQRARRARTVKGRRRMDLYRLAWSGWARALRAAAREQRARYAQELQEARDAEDLLIHAQMATTCASEETAAELARMHLVDEVQAAAHELARLEVEHDEVRSVSDSLEHAVSSESASVARLHQEAAELREQAAAGAAGEAEMRAALEDALRAALAAPAQLRAELRESEVRAMAFATEEAEAQQSAAQLRGELEELCRAASARVQERTEELDTMQAHVAQARRSVLELEEAVAQRRATLQDQELRIEQQRREDSEEATRMFQHFPPEDQAFPHF